MNQEARRLRNEIAPAMAAQLCLHSAMAGSRMAAPLFALHAGFSQAAAGLLVGLFAVAQVLISLPAGKMAEREGLKRPLSRSVAVSFVGIATAAVWPVYPVLCFTALCCGSSHGASMIALQRHVGRVARTPMELNQVFSWVSIAPAFANSVGPLLAGVLIDHGGFRVAFIGLGALPLIAWGISRKAHESFAETHSNPKTRGGLRSLLAHALIRRLLLMNWFMSAAWDFHAFMVPLIGHQRGMRASEIGLVLGAFAAAAAVIRFLLPMVAARVREWALIAGTISVAGVVLLCYPFTHSVFPMMFLSICLGVALGSVQPMVMSLLHQTTPPGQQGDALAVRMILLNLSSVAMPVVVGAAGGAVGISGAFWLMGALLTAGGGLGIGLRRVAASDHEGPPSPEGSPPDVTCNERTAAAVRK